MNTIPQRSFSRAADEIRPCHFRLGAAANAHGSALVTFGSTKVLCTATIDREVPRFQNDKGQGWLTAEYGMLPCATSVRNSREHTMNNGRTKEIQRLIGRSLRAGLDLSALAGYRIIADCDVLQADGGTRTASVCGAWLAVVQACSTLHGSGSLQQWPVSQQIAAISVGRCRDEVMVDLDYSEDSLAQVDSNVVMNHRGEFIEIQSTAERTAFSRAQLDLMLNYAQKAITRIMELQRAALADSGLTWQPD